MFISLLHSIISTYFSLVKEIQIKKPVEYTATWNNVSSCRRIILMDMRSFLWLLFSTLFNLYYFTSYLVHLIIKLTCLFSLNSYFLLSPNVCLFFYVIVTFQCAFIYTFSKHNEHLENIV